MNLSEINWDYNAAGSWPLKIKVIIILLICSLIVAGGIYQFILPQMNELDVLKQGEQALKKEFEKKQHQAANLPAYKKQFKKIQDLLSEMVKQMPSEAEVAQLLRKVSKNAQKSGLESMLFETEPPERKDFYFELPNKIEMLGKYNELGAFVSSLTTLSRIVTVHDVAITHPENKKSRKKDHQNNNDQRMEMKAIVKTYNEASIDDEDNELSDDEKQK